MDPTLIAAAATLAPWAVNLALALIVAEAAVLALFGRREHAPQGGGWPPGVLGHLAAGAALMLALRVALSAVPAGSAVPGVVLLCLTVAGLAHGISLWRVLLARPAPAAAPLTRPPGRGGRLAPLSAQAPATAARAVRSISEPAAPGMAPRRPRTPAT